MTKKILVAATVLFSMSAFAEQTVTQKTISKEPYVGNQPYAGNYGSYDSQAQYDSRVQYDAQGQRIDNQRYNSQRAQSNQPYASHNYRTRAQRSSLQGGQYNMTAQDVAHHHGQVNWGTGVGYGSEDDAKVQQFTTAQEADRANLTYPSNSADSGQTFLTAQDVAHKEPYRPMFEEGYQSSLQGDQQLQNDRFANENLNQSRGIASEPAATAPATTATTDKDMHKDMKHDMKDSKMNKKAKKAKNESEEEMKKAKKNANAKKVETETKVETKTEEKK